MTSMVPPHIRDQLGHLASQDGPSAHELYEQQRERDLREEQERQSQRDLQEQARQREDQEQLSESGDAGYVPWRWRHRSRYRDYDRDWNARPAPPAQRELTMRDVADYERYSEIQELRDMARELQRQDRLKSKIEDLMRRDINAYFESGWPQVYSSLTGANKDAESRK